MARRGKTLLLKKPGDIPMDTAKGVQFDASKQASGGKETTYNSSIESITFHLCIMLLGCAIAYLLMNWVRANNVPIITQIPIWAYAIIVMFGVNFLIQKLKMGTLVDNKTKSKITGTLSDFAITAAIASMPLQTILTYMAPILFMCLMGYTVTFLVVYLTVRYSFSDCVVERTATLWGATTGVFLTGLMLLKICDPDYELPVLNDYTIGFSFTSITGFIMMPVLVNMMIFSGTAPTLIFQLGIFLATFILLAVATKAGKKFVKA
jgi:ESS family glutamate:Na+ symporter